MTIISSIAVATDFSPGANAAVERAVHLAVAHGASTHRAVIGRLPLHLQQIKNRCHHAFGLSQRLVKHQAQHQAAACAKCRVILTPVAYRVLHLGNMMAALGVV